MKQWWRRIVVFLFVACIFLGTSRNVMAEGKLIPAEIVEKYMGKSSECYDVGGGIGNGAFEMRSTSKTLKVGDTVEVQVIYNADNTGSALNAVNMSLYYDMDLLQYSNTILNDAYVKKYPYSGDCTEYKNGVYLVVDFPNVNKSFDQNDWIVTVQFTVKQETPTVTIYGGEIDAAGLDADSKVVAIYHYLYDKEDGGNKMMSVTVEDTSISEPTPTIGTFALSDGTVEGKEDIQIPIKIQTNDGFAALGLTINYDTTLFDYKTLEVDSNLKDKIALKDIYPNDGQIKAAFIAGQNITDVGNFLNLTLETKENAPIGTSSDVTITVTQVANYEEKSLNATGAIYTVTLEEDIPEQLLGDVNNDGNIDLVDALGILQYYNNVKELTDNEKTAADVDKNGTVDLVDALRIMKYYNGELSEF